MKTGGTKTIGTVNHELRINSRPKWFLPYLRHYQRYLMLLPAVILLLIFHYYPIYGAQIAFKRFNPALGIWGSQWVGLDNINRFFNSIQFWSILWNTFSIKLFMIIAGFPIPIIIALIINEIPSKRFKKFVQTTIFAPHFISTVVMVGLIFLFTNQSKGIINHAIAALGFERIPFMSQPEWFRFVYIVSGIWQGSGWVLNAV